MSAGLKGGEGAQGFGERLLDEVFGFYTVAGEPAGVVIERGQQRERELLEGRGGFGKRHDAGCLGRANPRPMRLIDEDDAGESLCHHYGKPNCFRFIPLKILR